MPLKLMYITNNPKVALIAEKNGVDRIFVDLETLGKETRQKGMDTVKSKHTIADVSRMSKTLTRAELLVRVNPWNENSKSEIDRVIEAGADIIMLPMWKTEEEAAAFIKAVDGRARTMLLLETREAVDCLDDVLELCGIDEIHIGLNDLHLSYKLTFMFELLANGTIERLCNKIGQKGIPYGFGGIAALGNGALPSEKVITEHYRLGSTRVILSRSFCDLKEQSEICSIEKIFRERVAEIRAFEKTLDLMTLEKFELNRQCVCEIVENIVRVIWTRKL